MIPDWQTIMLPLLESLKDGEEHPFKQIREVLAAYFELEEEEIKTKSGDSDQPLFDDRLHQAKLHLRKADLLQDVNHVLKITSFGKQVLHKRLNRIDTDFLMRLPGYIEASKK